MKTIYTSLRTLACIVFLAGIFAACTDGNEWDVDASKVALFRVRNVSVPNNRVAAQSASVSWTATSTAEYYIIEVSTEALTDDMEMGAARNSIVYGENKSITSVPVMLTGLTKESTYYLRVKSFGSGMQSGWAYLDGSFTTTSEDILQKEFAAGDITGESILVKWSDAGLPVTHLVFEWEVTTGSEGTTDEGIHELTSEEISSQSAIISGLQPGTKYVVYIYNIDDLRGITEATTEQILNVSEVLGGSVTLSWVDNGIPVTKISYYPTDNNTNLTEQELTEQEINAGSTTINGLALGQTYTFTIYNNEALRGIAEATTEQIMFINGADVRGRSVTVTWAENEFAVTKLTYQAANGEEIPWEGELSAAGTDVTGLEGLTEYTFRVYTGDVLRGEQTVTTLAPMIDVTITAGITNATFTWEFDENVAAYSCTANGGYVDIVNLSDDEKSNGAIKINELTANTSYTFVLYNDVNKAVSNAQLFTTEKDPLEGYYKVYLNSPEEWTTIWDDTQVSGKVALILTKGTDYDMSGKNTSAIPDKITSLVIWGGEDGEEFNDAEKPVLGFRGLSFMAPSIDKIEFFNIAIKCDKNAGSAASSGNILFRQADPTTIGEMVFRSCKIFNARGFIVHDKSIPGTTKSITIDNCYFENIGDYAIIGNRNGHTINSISFTNSTVNNCAGNIFRLNQSSLFTLAIEYCTFYNCGGGSTEWIRSDSNADNISVTNSLFTSLYIKTQSDGICNTLRNTCSNVFYTNDCTGDTYANYWSTKLEYSASTLFRNPTEGDFTVQIPEYAIYGDPRRNNE